MEIEINTLQFGTQEPFGVKKEGTIFAAFLIIIFSDFPIQM